MLGLDPSKLFLLLILAAFLLGPSRMTDAARWLGQTVRQLRTLLDSAKVRAKEELGDDFDDIDWKKLDPRQYDPRRIISEAILAPPNLARHEEESPNDQVLSVDDRPAAGTARLNRVGEVQSPGNTAS